MVHIFRVYDVFVISITKHLLLFIFLPHHYDADMPSSATTKQSVTAKKQAAAAALKKPPAGAGAVDDVADGMDNLAIGTKSSGRYSFDNQLPWLKKGPYLKNDKDYVELEFACAPYHKESFQARLTKDGNVCSVRVGTPDFFAEEKRMRSQMGDSYHTNHPRVCAHKDVVQEVREECTKEQGDKYYGKVDQKVDLPVQCEGVPNKMFSYMPYGWVEKPVDGEPNRRERHTQFLLIVTLVFNVAKKRTKKEKRGIELVCAALSADSDDEDMNA